MFLENRKVTQFLGYTPSWASYLNMDLKMVWYKGRKNTPSDDNKTYHIDGASNASAAS